MLAELTRVETAWPLLASAAAAAATRGLAMGRRRAALNEALHELRRPLQALVLARPVTGGATADLPLQAALALDRLDREINGGAEPPTRAPVGATELAAAAVERWRRRAELAGSSLRLRPGGAAAIVSVDRVAVGQALDNLIVNAIDHGGARVLVGAELGRGAVRFEVADSGRRGTAGAREREGALRAVIGVTRARPLAAAFASLHGRRRHGHGLRLVRRIAAAHGGHFRLERDGDGATATLDLPLAGGGAVA